MAVLLVVAGLVALLAGAELLVRAGSRLAHRLGVPPLLIGLTVVSIGTSIPELAVGIGAARGGTPGLAVGNVTGTNLVNILCILGLSALLSPIVFQRRTLRFELPAMIASVVGFYLLSLDGHLGLLDGILLVAGAVIYTALAVRRGVRTPSDRGDPSTAEAVADAAIPLARTSGLLVLGIAVIIGGAEMLVHGSASVARSMGVSDTVIGLTVIALGTSAPELVTTVVSTVRGDRDIAVGNLLGSSTYNIVLVLGVTVIAAPRGVAVPGELLSADLLLLVAVTVACAPVVLHRSRITRLEGALFVAAYGTYLSWLLATRV